MQPYNVSRCSAISLPSVAGNDSDPDVAAAHISAICAGGPGKPADANNGMRIVWWQERARSQLVDSQQLSRAHPPLGHQLDELQLRLEDHQQPTPPHPPPCRQLDKRKPCKVDSMPSPTSSPMSSEIYATITNVITRTGCVLTDRINVRNALTIWISSSSNANNVLSWLATDAGDTGCEGYGTGSGLRPRCSFLLVFYGLIHQLLRVYRSSILPPFLFACIVLVAVHVHESLIYSL